MFLEKINSPKDIKKFDAFQLQSLCNEIRSKLIETVSSTGGHLASNLGVVELTVALHYVFDSPDDSILFDVGHQCYIHKLLTGRAGSFSTIRQENGISGFMNPDESEHDPFITGHSSESISVASGIARANAISGNENYSLAVIGDGAFTGGEAFEAINNASRNDKLIVVLNDNRMSISRNVGAIARYLTGIRTKSGYIHAKNSVKKGVGQIPVIGVPLKKTLYKSKMLLKNAIYNSNIFENFGLYYMGPVDGHNLEELIKTFKSAKEIEGPVIIHACTVKGKGYEFAEKNPKVYHGISNFDVDTGVRTAYKTSFSEQFGKQLCKMAEQDQSIYAITAAMTEGTGLAGFREKFRNRFSDVGIAEQHAVSFAAGLAVKGMRPVFAVYSSFLQRAYDQLITDAAIMKNNMLFAIDRAGIVGEDGVTHQGVFDVSYLNSIPDIKVYSPSTYKDLEFAMNDGMYNYNGPVAVRYPRGGQAEFNIEYNDYDKEFAVIGNRDAKKVIVTYGRMFGEVCKAYETIVNSGNDVCIVKLNVIKPIPHDALTVISEFEEVYFYEESIRTGSVGEKVCSFLYQNGYKGKFTHKAVEDEFVPHMSVNSALKRYGLCADEIVKTVYEGEGIVG